MMDFSKLFRPTVMVLLALGTSFAAGQISAQETTKPVSLSDVDTIIEDALTSKAFPGAVLIIGRGPQVLHQKAYGHYTFKPDAKPMTLDTLFDLASISKVVGTASTAMALFEDGRLDLNAPVSQYVNGFGAKGKDSVRVRDLMTHVSGLPSYDSPANAKKLQDAHGISTADAMIMRIAQLAPKNEPRTTTTYSCLNMLTQARVNENILGGRQDDFITGRVYGPLGMKDTTYRPTAEQLARTAPTVRKADGSDFAGWVHDPLAAYHSPELHCPGNAGVFATAPDLARYCEMIAGLGSFRGKQIYKPETITTMTSINTPAGLSNVRGLGWDIFRKPPEATPFNNVDGKRAIAHTGYTGTMIWIDMNTGAYMVLLTNRTYPNDSKESSRGTSATRRRVIDTILRTQPEYKEYFASLPVEEERGARRGAAIE